MIPVRIRRKIATAFLLALVVGVNTHSAAAFQSNQNTGGGAIHDWTKIVPADARFYVELRDLAGVRTLFRRLGIWELVRELSESQRSGTATHAWQRSAEQLLGMDADAAIDQILGRRSALIASESAEWQNAVLLAELDTAASVSTLLDQWQAKKLEAEGAVQRYSLNGGLMLATLDRTLAIGPPDDPEGLWGRTVQLLSGRRGPSLAGRAEFAALRSRAEGNDQGLMYVAWQESDPTSFAGCSRLLANFSITGSQINCELHGQRSAHAATEAPCDAAWIGSLPASTLAVITDSFDFSAMGHDVQTNQGNAGESAIAFMVGAFSAVEGSPTDLFAKLGPAYTIVLDAGASAGRAGPALPATAAICRTPEPAITMQQLDAVFGFMAQLFESTSTLAGHEPKDLFAQKETCESIEIRRLEIGPALARHIGMAALESVSISWAVLDDRLIISSSTALVRNIVRAARGKVPRLDSDPSIKDLLPRKDEGSTLGQWVYLRARAASQILSDWLKYLARERPEMLSDDWWKRWAAQRLSHYTRLGITLEPDKTSPVRAIVSEVESNSPAQSLLRRGDIILGAAGRALATTRPAEEVAQRYRARGNTRRFAVRVLRAGQVIDIEIPVQPVDPIDLQDFDPIRAVRMAIALTRRVEFMTIRRAISKPDRVDSRIMIRWEPPQ